MRGPDITLLAIGALAAAVGWAAARCDAADYESSVSTPIDLAKAFDTKSDWRLVASFGPPTVDAGDNPAPGALTLCLEKGPGAPCLTSPVPMPPSNAGGYSGWEPHYVGPAEPVYPHGPKAPPLLLIVTASMHSGDGDQVVVTQLLKYDRAGDAFERVYLQATGHNNNQEVRFISGGPLEGDVIFAAPTEDAPYGYWITVSKPTPADSYSQVLRYRSATHYGDGNPLPVIDSEMANIEQHLGLWRQGSPLPLPATPCPKPRLVQMELWCN